MAGECRPEARARLVRDVEFVLVLVLVLGEWVPSCFSGSEICRSSVFNLCLKGSNRH